MNKTLELCGVLCLCFVLGACKGSEGKSTPTDPGGMGGDDSSDPKMTATLNGSDIHVVLENMADDSGNWLGWIGSPLPPPPNGSESIIWESIPGDFITGNFVADAYGRHYMHLDVWDDGGFNGWNIAQTQYGAALHFTCAEGAQPTSITVEVMGMSSEGEPYYRRFAAALRIKSDTRSYRLRAN